MTTRISSVLIAALLVIFSFFTTSISVAQPTGVPTEVVAADAWAKANSALQAQKCAKGRLAWVSGRIRKLKKFDDRFADELKDLKLEMKRLEALLTPTCLMAKDSAMAKACWEVAKAKINVASDRFFIAAVTNSVNGGVVAKLPLEDGTEAEWAPKPGSARVGGAGSGYPHGVKAKRIARSGDVEIETVIDSRPNAFVLQIMLEERLESQRIAAEANSKSKGLNLNAGWYLGAAATCGALGYAYGDTRYPDTETPNSFLKSSGPLYGLGSAAVCVGGVLIIDALTD